MEFASMTDAQTWYTTRPSTRRSRPLRVNNAVRAAIRVSNRGGPRCAIEEERCRITDLPKTTLIPAIVNAQWFDDHMPYQAKYRNPLRREAAR